MGKKVLCLTAEKTALAKLSWESSLWAKVSLDSGLSVSRISNLLILICCDNFVIALRRVKMNVFL